MKKIFIATASLALLGGCAPLVHNGSLSQADQLRIMQEVEASRKSAAEHFYSFANVCMDEFPAATDVANDGAAHLSEQGSVNVALKTEGIALICSVNISTKQIERIYAGGRTLDLAGFRTYKANIAASGGQPPITPGHEEKQAVAVAPPQQAQSNILLEACNNIADSAKRLDCFKAIPQTASPVAQDNKDEVRRAFTDLSSILNAGTSYNSYSSQLESVVKAVGRYQAAAQSEADRKSATLLAEALEAHKDAQFFWQRDISWYARSSNATAYPGGLPIQYTGTGYLVPKYNLATQKSDFWGFSQGLPRAQTLRAIWQYADGKVNAALK